MKPARVKSAVVVVAAATAVVVEAAEAVAATAVVAVDMAAVAATVVAAAAGATSPKCLSGVSYHKFRFQHARGFVSEAAGLFFAFRSPNRPIFGPLRDFCGDFPPAEVFIIKAAERARL
jgi:hypothetical protein